MGVPGLDVEARQLVPAVVEAFRRNGLINFAAATAFLIVLALVPFLLFLLALIGFLDPGRHTGERLRPRAREGKLDGR